MAISIKIYQSKMLNEVLAASSLGEIQSITDTALRTLEKQHISDKSLLTFIDGAVKELESLNDSLLPYDYYARIITALVHLKKIRLQLFSEVDESFKENV